MDEFPVVIRGSIDDKNEYLISKVNNMLSNILKDGSNLHVCRISRVTKKFGNKLLKHGYICVWIY